MAFITTTDKAELEKYQAEVDSKEGYPEDLVRHIYVGGGIHAPKELGQAKHFAEIIEHPDKAEYALPQSAKAEVTAKLTVVGALSVDWIKAEEIIGA